MLIKLVFLSFFLLIFNVESVIAQVCYNYLAPISTASSSVECIAKSETAIYYGGSYNQSIDLSGYNFQYSGGLGSDVFFAKTDQFGQLVWAKTWGGKAIDRITAITTFEDKVYAAGFFKDTLYIENDTLFNYGQTATFIIAYDTLGNYLSSFSPDAYNMRIAAMEVSTDGALLITGDYFQYFNMDGQSFMAQNGFNYFLMKYNYWTGSLDWFNESNGNNTAGIDLAQDQTGGVYVCGAYGSGANIGGSLLSNTTGNHSAFVAKYSDIGVFEWVETIEGLGEIHAYGIDVTPSGQVFVSGEFENTISSPTFSSPISAGLYDVFVVSYTTSGNIVWTKSFGGTDNDIGRSLRLDYNNDPVVLSDAGAGFSINGTLVVPNGDNEPLIVKLRKTDGYMVNHYRVKAKNTIGAVQSKQFEILDSTIFVGGKNFSSIWCGSNEYSSQNANDGYLLAFSDSLTYTQPTNIEETIDFNNFYAYPNPAKNVLNIKFKNADNHNVKLFSALGQLMIEENAIGIDLQLNLEQIKNRGIYLLVIDNNITQGQKIVITK